MIRSAMHVFRATLRFSKRKIAGFLTNNLDSKNAQLRDHKRRANHTNAI